MKFSGKICFKIVLKVTKKPSIEATLSTEDTFFKKPPGGGGVSLIPPGILELRVKSSVPLFKEDSYFA